MKNDLEDMIIDISDEELDDVLDNIIVQLQTILEKTGAGHIVEGNLTFMPATEYDTIH